MPQFATKSTIKRKPAMRPMYASPPVIPGWVPPDEDLEEEAVDYVPPQEEYIGYVPPNITLQGGFGSGGLDSDFDEFEEPFDDVDLYEPPQKRRKISQKSPKPHYARASRVSLDHLLSQTEGLTESYVAERRAFYEELEKFYGVSPEVNMLSGEPIDLFHLYIQVTQLGGFKEVCANKKWATIYRSMPQYSSTHTSASNALKRSYRRNLMTYEEAQQNNEFPENE